jgi:hypothetical protein
MLELAISNLPMLELAISNLPMLELASSQLEIDLKPDFKRSSKHKSSLKFASKKIALKKLTTLSRFKNRPLT